MQRFRYALHAPRLRFFAVGRASRWGTLLAAWFLLLGMQGTASAGPIVNGSFEDPLLPGPGREYNPLPAISGWTFSSGFWILEQGVNSTTNLAADDGIQFMTAGHNGSFGDTASQTFATLVGVEYQVSFSIATVQGNALQGMLASVFDVSGMDSILLGSTQGSVTTQNVWTTFMFGFTATSELTQLVFEHNQGNSSLANIALDNVLVEATVIPELTTFALVLLGLTGLALRGTVRTA